ncbi:MAG: BlaI/MecI/CopY family transcriptional regulator [Lachnospiraceae bacterium]|jgi:BlaI family penicillinase repressor|nr:BlaI/MecI/CopY family transcriptional regulator [Lachnospiraceae bacterium]
MEEYRLFESEYRFMDLIWRVEPVKSTQLVQTARLELEWKKSTCYTVLKKLEAKGFVKNEDTIVYALVKREQVQRYESEQLIARSFGGSLPVFLNTFLKGRRLTKREAKELHALIEDVASKEAEEVPHVDFEQ